MIQFLHDFGFATKTMSSYNNKYSSEDDRTRNVEGVLQENRELRSIIQLYKNIIAHLSEHPEKVISIIAAYYTSLVHLRIKAQKYSANARNYTTLSIISELIEQYTTFIQSEPSVVSNLLLNISYES